MIEERVIEHSLIRDGSVPHAWLLMGNNPVSSSHRSHSTISVNRARKRKVGEADAVADEWG